MKQNVKNGGNGTNGLVGRFAAEKKKTVTALCLIALMVFMWARVLSRKTPKAAAAAPGRENVATDILGSNVELKISFIELPNVKGRNDVLTRDFFATGGGSVGEVNVVSDGNEEVVRRIAGKLELGVIDGGENPQAFINDKLLSVGDKLLVGDGIGTYECEIVGIEKTEVFIRCGEAEIQLKLAQENERTG